MKYIVSIRGFHPVSRDRTSAANVATGRGEVSGIADRTRTHSAKSFLLNAPMSCSMESSRAVSGIIMLEVNRPIRSVIGFGHAMRVLKWNPCADLQNQKPEI